MALIVDFLNHGLLPFVGRTEELERLVRFAKGTVDAPELRLLLVVGEAGSGKSRLFAEGVDAMGAAGVLPIHLRIYPDTAGALVPLVADALTENPALTGLLREPVESSVVSVISALRRLARLRSICLLVEDIHLLEKGGLAEFARLGSGLFNESISIAAAARPLPTEVRSAIEPYLVDELNIAGFESGDLVALWGELLGSDGPSGLLEELAEATRGNPLAIRSALRGAFRSGAIELDGTIATERSASIGSFFREGASRFGEGLAIGLVDEEREALGVLSHLGEIFAIETASAMLGERADAMLEQLLFKGMLAEASESAAPIGQNRSGQRLLIFSHTLVHRQIFDEAEAPIDQLVQAVTDGLPLYSRLPIDVLIENIEKIDAPSEEISTLLEAIRTIAAHADHAGDVPYVLKLQSFATDLFAHLGDRLDPEEHRYRRAWLAVHAAGFVRRDPEELARVGAEAMALIDDPSEGDAAASEQERWLRLRLLALHFSSLYDDSPEELRGSLQKVQTIFASCNEVASSGAAIKTLRFIALRAAAEDDWDLLREIEQEAPVDTGLLDSNLWGYADLLVLLCLNWNDPEEFTERARLFALVESPGRWRKVTALYPMMRWLLDAGRADHFLAHVDAAIDLYRRYEAVEYVWLNDAIATGLRYLIGADRRDPVALLDGMPFDEMRDPDDFARYVYRLLADFALMRGDTDAASRALTKTPVLPSDRLLIDDDAEIGDLFSATERSFADQLADNILRLGDAPKLLASLALYERGCEAEHPAIAGLPDVAADAVRRLFAYYTNPHRRFDEAAATLLKRFGGLLGKKELRRLKEQVTILQQDRRADELVSGGTSKRHLAVIGQLAVTDPEEQPRELRGERVAACIGALVANSLLRAPLELVDFARLATAEEDPAHARKILKVAMFRTREAIGVDAVDAGADDRGPTINREVIDVDLFTLVDAIEEGSRALLDKNLARARGAAFRAIDLFGSDVILPGLYDPVFEAIREEQEARLRELIIRHSEKLHAENDFGSSELLLRRALGVMPEDEEFAELLRDGLRAQGMLADAETVRVDDEY